MPVPKNPRRKKPSRPDKSTRGEATTTTAKRFSTLAKPDTLSKMFYNIAEVADLLGVAQSTLRFWEEEFEEAVPRRTPTGRRTYTPKDIERLRVIRYLVRDRGLRLEAAREALRTNREGISRKALALERLRGVRATLQELLDALNSLK